jgi:DNA-binding HxlR family transcriptional regulator
MIKDIRQSEACDIANALALVGGKWKLHILWKLWGKTLRFAELRRAVKGISEPVLIMRLKELERDGLVKRTSYPVVPPRVEYELTPAARELGDVLKGLSVWARENSSSTKFL